jgi:hypothetical protein
MELSAAQRYLRQIALPEVGPDGQQRLAAATVAVASASGEQDRENDDEDLAAEVAARYLAAGGVGRLRLIGAAADQVRGHGDPGGDFAAVLRASNPDVVIDARAWPADGAAWLAALAGVDLVVRSGFDDDPMLRAAVRLGLPVVLLRALDDRAEVLALRRQGPCPHQDLAIPPRRAEGTRRGAAAVVAGTLGAAEAMSLIVGRAPATAMATASGNTRAAEAAQSRARHLAVPLDGAAPRAQEIPWSPACFACGGGAMEMDFS